MKIIKEMGLPDHLTCLLRNLYEGQGATVRTRHEITDWIKTGTGVQKGGVLSPLLFIFYVEDIMQNTGLDESKVGIKIPRRNINNLRYAVDIIQMAENEEALKSFLMRLKEESGKRWLKTQYSKN